LEKKMPMTRIQGLWAVVYRREYRGYFLLIVTTYAYIVLAVPFSLLRLALLIGLGIVYMLTGLFGLGHLRRAPSQPLVLAYFVEQIAICGVILYLSQGVGILLFAPLAAYSVVLLQRWGMVVICGLSLLLLVFVDWRMGSPLLSILASVLSMLSAFVFVTVFTKALLDEALARDALGEAHQQLREYAAQIETLATTVERNRLAREIHDSVGHYFTTINIQLEAARAILDEDPARARSTLEKVQMLTREGLGQIRNSVAALRTLPTENRSLPEALAELVRASQAEGGAITLNVIGTLPPLSSHLKFMLYRVAQEGLTNARKHAHAEHIEITLDGTNPHTVKLRIKDNGVGSVNATGGFGLLGVRERVLALDGQLRIVSTPGEGFLLEVESSV
jgi:signal transduction histidine kinase